MPTKTANLRRLKCVRGGFSTGKPLLIALGQHSPRFIFFFNSEKGPAELSKVPFHPCRIFSSFSKSAQLAPLTLHRCGCPGDTLAAEVPRWPSFQLSLRLTPVFVPQVPPTFAVQLLAQNSHSCVSHSKQKITLCTLMYVGILGVCMCVLLLTNLLPIAVQPQLALKPGKYVCLFVK